VSQLDLEEEYCRALGPLAIMDALVKAGISRREGLLQAGGFDDPAKIPLPVLASRCREDE